MPGPSEELAERAALFKAIGDPTRLAIVTQLAALPEGEDLCACHIEGHFELAQATISHHLKVLRTSGWVTAERRGTWSHYRLDPAAVSRLGDLLDLLRCPVSTPPSPSCC